MTIMILIFFINSWVRLSSKPCMLSWMMLCSFLNSVSSCYKNKLKTTSGRNTPFVNSHLITTYLFWHILVVKIKSPNLKLPVTKIMLPYSMLITWKILILKKLQMFVKQIHNLIISLS